MALRCLLFSTNEEIVQPIWQVLADLGIEGEYCQSAVDAVERVTTQLFQIVMTDWDDQPEAAFLLKTARDLKAAARPLTLAIVSDEARLPEALQAGANSVLLKPLRPEQVRDTMSTACQLLRAKQPPETAHSGTQKPVALVFQDEMQQSPALAAAAAASAAPAPVLPTQAPEKLRAGEFLQTPSSAPGAQFDTEEESEVQQSLDQAAIAEVEALTELEPMAAAVQDAPAEPTEAAQEPLTGWAALQARLTKPMPPPAADPSPKNELMSYGETPSPASQLPEKGKDSASTVEQPQAESEAALFAYVSGESKANPEPSEQSRPKRGKLIFVTALAIACVILVGVPQMRRNLPTYYRNSVRTAGRWLNPPPAALPAAVAQHDSFGQSGDEYKLPVPTNIPDATTDPSQIRVLNVIDPTAKPDKNAAQIGGPAQTSGSENPTDQNQSAPSQSAPSQSTENQSAQSQTASVQVEEKTPPAAVGSDVPASQANPAPTPPSPATPVQQNTPAPQTAVPPTQAAGLMRNSTPSQTHAPSASANAGIPSSLKSQIASSTPESSGTKPSEAAMSSIEPVGLSEAAVRELLAQSVDAAYPAAAKASGQRGSVVLQVLIGRDGTVQDAKFLQGSLVFARAAIDAVKQWRFKPYSLNGRAVSVQSALTLNFVPPA
jgi:protein TonB